MLTEKDYCDYDTSRELKELGFVAGLGEDDCGYCLYDDAWHDQVNRPLLYEAQKWLREEKKLIVLVGFDFCPITSEIVYNWVIVVNGNTAKKSSFAYDYFEEALSEGIKEAVKILKNGIGK